MDSVQQEAACFSICSDHYKDFEVIIMKKAVDWKSKRLKLILWATIVIVASFLATIFPNAIVQTASTIIALYALYKTVGVPKSYYKRVDRIERERKSKRQENQ